MRVSFILKMTLVWMSCSFTVFAADDIPDADQDFNFQGLWYTVLSKKNNTCRTKACQDEPWMEHSGNVVSGNVEIPSVVTDGKRDYTVVEIGESGFNYCKNLSSIKIPETVTFIGENSFHRCEGLISVDLPESIRIIGKEAFSYCLSLEEIIIPENVSEIPENAFKDCTRLKRCTMPEGLKSIGGGAFETCDSLDIGVLPDGLERIGPRAFRGCDNSVHLYIPDSVTEIGDCAFSYMMKLKSVRLPKGMKKIEGTMFAECNALASVIFPPGLESIGDPSQILYVVDAHQSVWDYDQGVFYNCHGLESITLPNSVSYIGLSAFEKCENLKTVVLPTGLKNIGEWAFGGCESLQEIVYPVSDPQELSADLGDDFLYPDFPRLYGFDNTTYEEAVLKIGIGGIEKARERAPWKFFKHIEEIDFSGIDEIVSEPDKNNTDVYTIDGVRIGDSTDGLPSGIYIVRNDGKAKKVMVK